MVRIDCGVRSVLTSVPHFQNSVRPPTGLVLCDFTHVNITYTYLSSAFAMQDLMTLVVIIRSYQIPSVEN